MPIPNAQIEVWMAGPDGEYHDDYRATFFSDENGAYSFESHFPPPYSGRPSHHHLLVTTPGYQTLVTQHYPQQGENQATFDLVLLPANKYHHRAHGEHRVLYISVLSVYSVVQVL
jgi:protocatechuate 3,4-dioxygenase beta subunit